MAILSSFTTALGDLEIYDNPRYCKATYHAKYFDSLEETKASVHTTTRKLKELGLEKLPCITDIRKVKGASKEVRDFLSKNDDFNFQISKIAILQKSGLSSIMGNLYLKFSRPPFPTKLFTNEKKAMQWLLPNEF